MQRTLLIGSQLPPFTMDHLLDLEEVLNCFLGRYPIVMGELKVDVIQMTQPWNQEVEDFLD